MTEYQIDLSRYDEWLPVGGDIEVMIRLYDPVGTIHVRARMEPVTELDTLELRRLVVEFVRNATDSCIQDWMNEDGVIPGHQVELFAEMVGEYVDTELPD